MARDRVKCDKADTCKEPHCFHRQEHGRMVFCWRRYKNLYKKCDGVCCKL